MTPNLKVAVNSASLGRQRLPYAGALVAPPRSGSVLGGRPGAAEGHRLTDLWTKWALDCCSCIGARCDAVGLRYGPADALEPVSGVPGLGSPLTRQPLGVGGSNSLRLLLEDRALWVRVLRPWN